MSADVDASLARLDTLSSAELKAEWHAFTGTPLPRVSPSLLRLALAWEIQAKAYGGHSREVTRKLAQLGAGKTSTAPVRAGMRLVREWNGKVQVVTVGEDNIIRWNDGEYGSLSEVARAITVNRRGILTPDRRPTVTPWIGGNFGLSR